MKNNVIDFISIKNKRINEQLHKVFSKANSLKNAEEIHRLVQEKTVAVQDHKFFLAFLNILEDQKIEPVAIFRDVLKLPKHQFEDKYMMNWDSVVQLCFTFLAIIKESDPAQYEQFISQGS
ncbi:hypothetical protein ACOQFO_13825 [Ureibacillus sp. MALMAid1270]|uniref:hypothetical protein n=1 Tax=Ureibacillus sp. MALMAid1270 TaxID=3411629 RepID=UPI003BA44558